MASTVPAVIENIDRATLTPVVRRALDNPTVEIVDWQRQPLGYQAFAPITAGLFRFFGSARERGDLIPWSVILKAVQSPEGQRAPFGIFSSAVGNETSMMYWKREPLVYQSGLLSELPAGGIVAPRCLGVDDVSPRLSLLWLEHAIDVVGTEWPLSRFGIAARHLGVYSAGFAAREMLPNYPWFCGSAARWFSSAERLERSVALLDGRNEVWKHPVVREVYPSPPLARLRELATQLPRFLSALDRLPPTLLHGDPFRSNLIATRGDDGRDRTVAVDWSFVGRGAIGEDIGLLVTASHLLFRTGSLSLTDLDATTSGGYLEGLRQGGWEGDARLARLGTILHEVLRYGFSSHNLWLVTDERMQAFWKELYQLSLHDLLAHYRDLLYFTFERADEATRLISDLGLD